MARHMRGPIDQQPDIGRGEILQVHATRHQQGRPFASGAKPPPTRPAKRQHRHIGLDRFPPAGRIEGECVPLPATPLPTGVDRHSVFRQPREPCPQQGRGFHRPGENPPGGAGKDLLSQPFSPVLHRLGIKGLQHRTQGLLRFFIGGEEGGEGLGLGQVQPGFARHQELAPDRRFRLTKRDRQPRLRHDLCRHQPRRAAPDDQGAGHAARSSIWFSDGEAMGLSLP